jgi:carbamoyltransferase
MSKSKYLLSVSCGHDSSATLLRDGFPVVAIAQERIDRRKHSNAPGIPLEFTAKVLGFSEDRNWEPGFPWDAVAYCLDAEGISLFEIDLFTSNYIFQLNSPFRHRLPFPNHHLCHAASCFYGSGFQRAAIFVADYGGDTLMLDEHTFLGHERQSAWVGDQNGVTLVWRQLGSNSGTLLGLGAAYSKLADYLFPVSDSEGKLMSLSPTGEYNYEHSTSFFQTHEGQVYVRPTGLFIEHPNRPASLNPNIPNFEGDLDWDRLPPPPCDVGEFNKYHRDLAAKMQGDLEEALLYITKNLKRITTCSDLCIAGGIGLNCIANERIRKEAGFDRVFVAPSPGDTGQSLGAALYLWQQQTSSVKPKRTIYAYLGREYDDSDVQAAVEQYGDTLTVTFSHDIVAEVVESLISGQIIGWFQGKSEFGPRALGSRSIVADPRNVESIERLNRVVKKRYTFQPIAPSVLAERSLDFFESSDSPFMSFGVKALPITKAKVPGIVHIDGSSRIQTVEHEYHDAYYRLISYFEKRTGVPIIANTSFNGKGEPIVESPHDAIRTFCNIPLDALCLGNYMIERNFSLEAASDREPTATYGYA